MFPSAPIHQVEVSHLLGLAEGSLEVKLPTIWRDGLTEVGTVREEKRRSEKRKSAKKDDAGAQKARKVAIHGVFQ